MGHTSISVLAVVMAVFASPLFFDLALCITGNLFKARKPRSGMRRSVRMAVIIPAHDEEALIARTVLSVKAADATTAIYVVAHNCTDGTAIAAAKAGAMVITLNNPKLRGKGAALRAGFDAAQAAGFDSYLVVDADSVVSGNLILETKKLLVRGAEATQCRYELALPHGGADSAWEQSMTRLRSLAFRGMNVLRARGRAGLGFSTGVFGNGFALTSTALSRVPFSVNSIAEDVEYHTKLVREGLPVYWVEDATVHAHAPTSGKAQAAQEARWEGGRLHVGTRATSRLLSATLRGRWRALETLADVLSLPLSRGIFALLLTLTLAVHWLHVFAFVCATIALLYVLQAAVLGKEPMRDLGALAAAPVYLLWKMLITPLVVRQSRSRAEWARTKREAARP